jgi:hypothetical protein
MSTSNAPSLYPVVAPILPAAEIVPPVAKTKILFLTLSLADNCLCSLEILLSLFLKLFDR